VVAAGHHEQQVGVDLGDRVPGRLAGGLAVQPEHVPATRPADLVRHPVADRERRIEPLEPDHTRPDEPRLATLLGLRLDRGDPFAEPADEVDGRVLRVGHRADGRDRVQDPLDARRLERDDGRVHLERPDASLTSR
jgi:hypothetical protein